MTTTERVRYTCKRCGKRKMKPASDDMTEPYLCQRCDDRFIAWQNAAAETADEKRRTLEAFLAQRPQF